MSKEPWYDSANPFTVARGATWRIGLWITAVIAITGVISGGVWLVMVATSDARGKGKAVQIKNDGTNRVLSQQEFEQRYADIIAADKRVQVAWDALKTDTHDPLLRTQYTGAVQYCQGAVGEYNAAARVYTKEAFRATDLPAQIDDTDPATDCHQKIEETTSP